MAAPKTGPTAPHVPTDRLRGEVSALTSFGNTQEEIARHLGIDEDTLAKYYRDELDNSVLRANSKVAKGLFKKATEDEDLSAQIFWLKTRARWRDRDSVNEPDTKQVNEDCKKRMQEQDEKNKKPY
ncbi:MAG TPA: hypothetical protein VGJ00_10450 [Rhabdochlamydiaceae bacterium]|jgi:predicted transcriptional regulator